MSPASASAQHILPNTVVVGAMKAATTTLHYYMQSHPQCFAPSIGDAGAKEPRFFCSDYYRSISSNGLGYSQPYVASFEEYLSLYEKACEKKVLVDVSPQYLYLAYESAERILDALGPDATIIAVLRDPVDRAFSAYLHLVREGYIFRETFTEALEREEARIKRGYPPVFHLTSPGLYAGQLEQYFMLFKNVHILWYDDILSGDDDFFKRLCSLLEIDYHASSDKFNVAAQPRSAQINRFLKRSKLSRVVASRLKRTPLEFYARGVRDALIKWNQVPAEATLQPEEDQNLRAYFRSENQRLLALLKKHNVYISDRQTFL